MTSPMGSPDEIVEICVVFRTATGKSFSVVTSTEGGTVSLGIWPRLRKAVESSVDKLERLHHASKEVAELEQQFTAGIWEP